MKRCLILPASIAAIGLFVSPAFARNSDDSFYSADECYLDDGLLSEYELETDNYLLNRYRKNYAAIDVYVQEDFASRMIQCAKNSEARSQESVENVLQAALEVWNQESRADALMFKGTASSKEELCDLPNPVLFIDFSRRCIEDPATGYCARDAVAVFDDSSAHECSNVGLINVAGASYVGYGRGESLACHDIDLLKNDPSIDPDIDPNDYQKVSWRLRTRNISSDMNTKVPDLKHVLIHEIGHALGLPHHSGPVSIMAAASNQIRHLQRYEQGCVEHFDLFTKQESIGRSVLTEHSQLGPSNNWSSPFRTTSYDEYGWIHSNLWISSGLLYANDIRSIGLGYVIGISGWLMPNLQWLTEGIPAQNSPPQFRNNQSNNSDRLTQWPNTRPVLTTLGEHILNGAEDDHRIIFHNHNSDAPRHVPDLMYKRSDSLFGENGQIYPLEGCYDSDCSDHLSSHLPLRVAYSLQHEASVFARVRTSTPPGSIAIGSHPRGGPDLYPTTYEHLDHTEPDRDNWQDPRRYHNGVIDVFVGTRDGWLNKINYAGSLTDAYDPSRPEGERWKNRTPRTEVPVGLTCAPPEAEMEYPCMIAWIESDQEPYDRIHYTYFRIDRAGDEFRLDFYPEKWKRSGINSVAGVDLAYFQNTFWMTVKSSNHPYGAVVVEKWDDPQDPYAWASNSPITQLTDYPIVDAPNFHSDYFGGSIDSMPLITWTVPVYRPRMPDCDNRNGDCWWQN